MKQHFAVKLQELRKKHGLSQEALAEILDVSRQSVSKWESGKIYPEIDKIIFLSEYFNISVDELLKESSERPVINLSKPAQSAPVASPDEEQDIMPYAYRKYQQKSFNIPPVQPNNIQPAPSAHKKSQKKNKQNAIITAIVVFAGAVIISAAISFNIALNENNYSYVDEDFTAVGNADIEPDAEITELQEKTAEYIDDNGHMCEYTYNPEEILNRIFYYYDKDSQQYIDVLIPFDDYEPFINHEYFKTANVYMEQYQTYLDVIDFNREGYYNLYQEDFPEDDVRTARFYSEYFGKYLTVLIPPTADIDYQLELYGYQLVDVYDNDGGIYQTIVAY